MPRALAIAIVVFCFTATASAAAELNIYSYRTPQLLQPFLDAYSEKTGVGFNVVHAPKGLIERLRSEGDSSPADIVVAVNVSRLVRLADFGLLTPLDSPVINGRIPPHLRDTQNRWTALSTRARVAAISRERVSPGAIKRIEDLVKPEWKGRICTRKGSHVYNRALLASLVAHLGEAGAEEWVTGLVANLARRPQGNDRAQAKAIFAGECDVALINTYYYGKMKFNDKDPEQRKWADAVQLVFLNQDDRGQHVNITGAGIVKSSRNKAEALRFIEWLSDTQAQEIYASVNFEYPANPAVAPGIEVASWGSFRTDSLPVSALAENSATAQMIIDRTGW